MSDTPTISISRAPIASNAIDYVLVRQGRNEISKNAVLVSAKALAKKIASYDYLINLCNDRLGFTTAFIAGLLAKKITLLPPNSQAGTIQSIAEKYNNLCFVVDCDDYSGLSNAIDIRSQGRGSDTASDAPTELPDVVIGREAQAAIAYTSGSTGEPKPQHKLWRTFLGTAALLGERFGSQTGHGKSSAFNIVATVPSQHMYGLEMTVLMALQNAWSVSTSRPFFPNDIAESLAAIPEPRMLVTTPVHLRALVGSGVELPAIEKIISATAPLPIELADQAEQMFSTHVYEIYGCTEAGSLATRRTCDEGEWSLLNGIEIYKKNDDAYVRGSHLPDDALLNDRIEIVSPTKFILQGRNNDLLNVGGKRASLAELNEKLLQIPGVTDGVIFLQEKGGNKEARTAALVVSSELSAENVIQELAKTVDPVFLPRPIKLVEALPRSATGKLPVNFLIEILNRKSN